MHIVIEKSAKKLTLWEQERLIHTCTVGIGREAVGTKWREGDYKTPEGLYRVCVKNPKSQYYLSLGLNYPNV